ncbi:MAG: ribosome small subunit-dependent GTPase A [Desulfococcaceae bacterium]|jgi:ribosome biogenesis GTPase|nr:ribosome small subunit-dependent GTPase A [Desulfococcaceae bacterium]
MDGIQKLGFDKGFTDNLSHEYLNRFEIARVTAVHKDSYIISKGINDVYAELVGKMLFQATSPLDYPAVGDWVLATFYDNNTFSVIHDILPRKTVLKRKTPGKRIDYQLIAANIDTAFIVQSLDADFNLRRLERYLVMVKEGNIRPVVLLSKSDLLSPGEIAGRVAEIHNIMPLLEVHPFSNQNESGVKSVKDILIPQQTYCLLGSSGVGKTTLLNKLIGESVFATGSVREKDCRGRHVTTYRHLIRLDCGAMLTDTPGMRELGNFSVETGMDETFTEIAAFAAQCRFDDCTHVNEKGCAVLQAVKDGNIPEERYRNYIKMKKESAYNEMSYSEKRQKDRQFGKLCKAVMKHKKNRK